MQGGDFKLSWASWLLGWRRRHTGGAAALEPPKRWKQPPQATENLSQLICPKKGGNSGTTDHKDNFELDFHLMAILGLYPDFY